MIAVIRHGFYLEFLFPLDQVRGWPRVIGPMLTHLAIRGQQTCVKYVMNGPGQRECESVSDG